MSASETRFDALTPIFGDGDPGGGPAGTGVDDHNGDDHGAQCGARRRAPQPDDLDGRRPRDDGDGGRGAAAAARGRLARWRGAAAALAPVAAVAALGLGSAPRKLLRASGGAFALMAGLSLWLLAVAALGVWLWG